MHALDYQGHFKRKKDRTPDTNNFLCHLVENKMLALNEEILNMIREHYSKEKYTSICFFRSSEKITEMDLPAI